MTMIFVIYAGISITFSLGFAAGAWWAARPRTDDNDSSEAAGHLRYGEAA